MLLGAVLLYVGVVLIVNGIWLIGQARVTLLARRAKRTRRSSRTARCLGPESVHRFRRCRRGCEADGPRQQPG